MTCCIGKARIYYQEPLHYQLNYSGSANGSVTASEPLTTECHQNETQTPGVHYVAFYKYKSSTQGNPCREIDSQLLGYTFIAPVSYSYTSYNMGWGMEFIPKITDGQTTWEGSRNTFWGYFTNEGKNCLNGYDFRDSTARFERVDGQKDPSIYTFKVIGTETGTIYRQHDGLTSCPAVDNLGCVMGEENYYDTLLPNQLPGGNVESSCFKKIPVPGTDCFHVVLETKYKNLADKTPTPPKTRSQLYLCGLPGCPAEYRIVCCPDGECEPERCPPDTDCELDCGSFVCCYKNGKVIKTIRK